MSGSNSRNGTLQLVDGVNAALAKLWRRSMTDERARREELYNALMHIAGAQTIIYKDVTVFSNLMHAKRVFDTFAEAFKAAGELRGTSASAVESRIAGSFNLCISDAAYAYFRDHVLRNWISPAGGKTTDDGQFFEPRLVRQMDSGTCIKLFYEHAFMLPRSQRSVDVAWAELVSPIPSRESDTAKSAIQFLAEQFAPVAGDRIDGANYADLVSTQQATSALRDFIGSVSADASQRGVPNVILRDALAAISRSVDLDKCTLHELALLFPFYWAVRWCDKHTEGGGRSDRDRQLLQRKALAGCFFGVSNQILRLLQLFHARDGASSDGSKQQQQQQNNKSIGSAWAGVRDALREASIFFSPELGEYAIGKKHLDKKCTIPAIESDAMYWLQQEMGIAVNSEDGSNFALPLQFGAKGAVVTPRFKLPPRYLLQPYFWSWKSVKKEQDNEATGLDRADIVFERLYDHVIDKYLMRGHRQKSDAKMSRMGRLLEARAPSDEALTGESTPSSWRRQASGTTSIQNIVALVAELLPFHPDRHADLVVKLDDYISVLHANLKYRSYMANFEAVGKSLVAAQDAVKRSNGAATQAKNLVQEYTALADDIMNKLLNNCVRISRGEDALTDEECLQVQLDAVRAVFSRDAAGAMHMRDISGHLGDASPAESLLMFTDTCAHPIFARN